MKYNVSSSCVYDSCRNGFNHFGQLFINGKIVAESKCHYINRTWEVYCGQSARKLACWNWMQLHEDIVKETIKKSLGLKRTTPKVKQILAKELAKDAKYKAVKTHYDSL